MIRVGPGLGEGVRVDALAGDLFGVPAAVVRRHRVAVLAVIAVPGWGIGRRYWKKARAAARALPAELPAEEEELPEEGTV